MLIAMATAGVTPGRGGGVADSDGWTAAFANADLAPPDTEPMEIAGHPMSFVWRSELVAATIGELPREVVAKAAETGWEIVSLSDNGKNTVPEELIRLLGGTA
jgi:hypothetical protein